MNKVFCRIFLSLSVLGFFCTEVSAIKEKKNEPGLIKKYLLSNPSLAATTFAAGYGLKKYGHGELSKLAYMYALSFFINMSKNNFIQPISDNFNFHLSRNLIPILTYYLSKKIFGRNEKLGFLPGLLCWICYRLKNGSLISFHGVSSKKNYSQVKKKVYNLFALSSSLTESLFFAYLAKKFGYSELSKLLCFYAIQNSIVILHTFIRIIPKLITYQKSKVIHNCVNTNDLTQFANEHHRNIDNNCKACNAIQKKVNKIHSPFNNYIIPLCKYSTPALTYLAAKKIFNVQSAEAN